MVFVGKPNFPFMASPKLHWRSHFRRSIADRVLIRWIARFSRRKAVPFPRRVRLLQLRSFPPAWLFQITKCASWTLPATKFPIVPRDFFGSAALPLPAAISIIRKRRKNYFRPREVRRANLLG